MATTTSTTTLGTSNLRGSARQTRNNPARTSRTSRPNLRQNSLISNPPASIQDAPEPHGFYPAISHFTDAITALPRDYRRHISLLKEVDAKAWLPEENLQKIISQCLAERQSRPVGSTAHTVAGSSSQVADDGVVFSTANSVNGASLDNVSQYSSQQPDPTVVQRRQLYHALRHNLMQMMVTMDEKNHVINNANEDLSRHIRRLDDVWPHVSDELSEEARLGSLKHWAYTDLNPPKKVAAAAAASRREAASGLAIMVDNDIAHRSESRREAMLAKKQRLNNQHVDSDFDDKAVGRKGAVGKGKKPDPVTEVTLTAAVTVGMGKRKKPERPAGSIAMERTASAPRAGAVAMSREPSQQDIGKKRKASNAVTTVARKRLNATQQESPKLVSSPLANATGKDAVKRSPALSTVRPVGRGRQNSAQTMESSKNRPSSSASYRNTSGLGLSASTPDLNNIAAATGKTTAEVKSTMKESTNSKGDKLVEDSVPLNGESTMRGGILLERSASSRGAAKKEKDMDDIKRVSSPRLQSNPVAHETKPNSRNRVSKISITPVVGSFAEAEADDSFGASSAENGTTAYSGSAPKPKRAPRPRMKDHHGLHDSLSPKGLPMKRTHAKNLSLSSFAALPPSKATANSRSRGEREDEPLTRVNTRNNAPAASQSTSARSEKSGVEDMDEDADADDHMLDDEDDLRYCVCNGVSYGDMVACDNRRCPNQWFHLECVGLKSLPKTAKWFCEECKETLARKGRFGNSNENGSGNGNGNGNGDK